MEDLEGQPRTTDTDPVAEFTPAEELGLVVVGAMTQLTQERDQARDMAVRLEQDLAKALMTLQELVTAWPETSWAQDSHAQAQAKAVILELTDPERMP